MEEAFPHPTLRRWAEKLIRWAYRSADTCLVTSKGVGQGLVDHFGIDPARIRIIGNPVDLDQVRAGTRAGVGVELPERFIVGVGRLAHQKGFDLLIEAFAKLGDDTLELVLVGTGPEQATLRAQAEGLGLGARTHFPGFVEHPSAVMAHAEIFCLPSRWEGFGHVVVEAMASGCPVLVADCDFGPGEIVDEGETGRVVPANDSDALAAALGEMLAHPEQTRSLAERAAKRAEDFSVGGISRAYWKLFAG
jgi:glycosyltransferase involved in cell wall biosynthesis